jgi:hypothetical protein
VPSGTKLSLAYVPYNKSARTTEGRYMLTFTWSAGTAAQIMETEGNDLSATATSQRYQWLGPTYFVNAWANTRTVVPLLYDLAYDSNLRSACSVIGPDGKSKANFYPFSEGVSDLSLKDNDDLSYVRQTMACSIGKGTCPAL